MPARKPSALITRHETADEADARQRAETALMPSAQLPSSAPAQLKNHPTAAREWRRLIAMYQGLDAQIVSKLDMGMLLDYCMLQEQLEELDELRKGAMNQWRDAEAVMAAFKKQVDANPGAEIDLKTFTRAAEAVNWAYDKIVKVDGRVDRKRALLFQLRQSLYLTPRSRAGVAPAEKPKEEPEDEMTQLLKSAG